VDYKLPQQRVSSPARIRRCGALPCVRPASFPQRRCNLSGFHPPIHQSTSLVQRGRRPSPYSFASVRLSLFDFLNSTLGNLIPVPNPNKRMIASPDSLVNTQLKNRLLLLTFVISEWPVSYGVRRCQNFRPGVPLPVQYTATNAGGPLCPVDDRFSGHVCTRCL